jgi:hypothetical protein
MKWRAALGLGLSLFGCTKTPAFPVHWELGPTASLRGADVAVRELSPRTRRTEVVTTPEATWTLIIDSAEVEAGTERGPAPVRVELTPTTVSAGLRLTLIRVGALEVAGTPPAFSHRIELATVDAKGDETTRLQISAAATGAPTVSPLRPFGK